MTLMEVLVALVILSLMSTFMFSNLGAWLGESRRGAEEAAFWRAATPAQLLLSELAAAAIDPRTRRTRADEIAFRALAPRLAMTPIDVTLQIDRSDGESMLTFSAPQLNGRPSVLLTSTAPLRFDTTRTNAVTLQVQRGAAWLDLASASFAADAPLVCAFDPISRTCR